MGDLPEASAPPGAPTVRVIAMPADANPYGDIFGGWLMSQMDLAAGSIASRHSHGRAVTIAVEGMQFHLPVSVGDEVSVYAELVHVGRTSMRIDVEAWRRHRHEEAMHKVTQACFTFVAIDEDRNPRRVPDLEGERA
ncbi:acyl-CoA thioesterase [Sphingomonas sp. AOB5]|uniref:acyl-CoA thioesterase n=1 Tax=Sphingomonas sp. AOB5 TaxID=3034017 RepID=UPI0023F64376|nr:acyl-CoA thioesterase [Sphingomonas sp. AOB5]MDF7774559.1 acyl-CoA thioesterase [Sphingomonas sp. AOB5]